jgi:Gpi18-like mannosyltransferase
MERQGATEQVRAGVPPRRALPRLGISLALALAIYGLLWPAYTFDAREFLFPWLEHIRVRGPVGAFAEPFSNYTPPYLYLLAIFSPLLGLVSKISVLKLVSLLGTLWLAWSFHRLLEASGVRNGARAAGLLILLPSVMLNAALLAQCDALWAAPCLLAIACAIERRPAAMLVWCGIAISIKAQAMFGAPFVIAVLLSQRTPLRFWLIPPAVYAAMMAPAWAAGWPAGDLATVYLRQVHTFDSLSMNAPNLWLMVQELPAAAALPLSGIAFAAAAAATIAYIGWFRRAMSGSDMIAAALLSTLMLPGLLPRMHDRYFFLADVLALALAIRCRDRSSWLILAGVQTGSTFALYSCITSNSGPAAASAIAMIAATVAVALRLLPPGAERPAHEVPAITAVTQSG